MYETKYRILILNELTDYYKVLDAVDFSHDSNHVYRVERLAKRIAEDEGADKEIIEAACLIFDVARDLEDKGEVEDHAEKACEIAREVLPKVDFPTEKIEPVCHAILVHRRSKDRTPETLEAKVLCDADRLDAMGAVDVARVLASSFQSTKYKRPIYVDIKSEAPDTSAIHFLLYQINHAKHQPDNFYTRLGQKIARERFVFMKEYADRFIAEWRGIDG